MATTTTSLKLAMEVLRNYDIRIERIINVLGQTALHIAAAEGQLDMAQTLIAAGADVNAKCQDKKTPLYYGCGRGSTSVVKYLLANGATVHAGLFALHIAARQGFAEIVELLLKAGADVSEPGDAGCTPARWSCCEVYGYITGDRNDEEIRKSKANALKFILEHGGYLHEVVNGLTLLHAAAANGLDESIRVLADKGLNPDKPLQSGNRGTALHMACFNGRLGVIKELYGVGANLEALDNRGRTPLFDAVMKNHATCVSTLINWSVSVEVRDGAQLTPLHAAAACGSLHSAYLLVEAGADVNAVTNEGYSPLIACLKPTIFTQVHAGTSQERIQVANFLLEMEAQVNKDVMKCAAENELESILVERLDQLKKLSEKRANTLATIAQTLVAHGDEVVCVRLVNSINEKESSSRVYKVNTRLVSLLTREESVLSRLMNPSSHGFKDTSTNCLGKEVTLVCDNENFTEEGFAAALEYITTAGVEGTLVHRTRRRRRSFLSNGAATTLGGGSGNDGDDGGGAPPPPPPLLDNSLSSRPLFDHEAAKKALQAAHYLCIDGMAEEVKRLLNIYGFEYDGSEEEDDDEDAVDGEQDTPLQTCKQAEL